MKPSVLLLCFGGAIVLAVIASSSISYELAKGRAAEFYQKHDNLVSLPNEMRSDTIRPVEVFGFIIGGCMIATAIRQSRATPVTPTAGVAGNSKL